MKCPCCKYEKRTFTKTVDKVIRYQSGQRKGEVKSIEKERLAFFEYDPDFIEIETKQGDTFLQSYGSRFWNGHIQLVGCPECGVVFIPKN